MISNSEVIMNNNEIQLREKMIETLIEQELATIDWELFPEVPVDATYAEAIVIAKKKLDADYSKIELRDILSLYHIFIGDEVIEKNGITFVEIDELKAKAE